MHETYTMVPKVLVECVKLLESRPMYMHHLGLYRASGNHADIQKLRFQIDANNYKTLYNQTDPHNITGIVKLFFRELKLPIVSLRQIDAVIPDDQFFIGTIIGLTNFTTYHIHFLFRKGWTRNCKSLMYIDW